MDIYKNLFDKGYLNWGYSESPISIKGMKKLRKIFLSKYDFINIKFVNEDRVMDEFEKFYESFNYLIIGSNEKLHEKKTLNSDEEDLFYNEIKAINNTYQNTNDKNQLSEDMIKYYALKIKQIGFIDIEFKIVKDLICKEIIKDPKERQLNFYIWVGYNHYSLVFNVETYYFFMDSCSVFFNRWPTKAIISNEKNQNFFQTHKVVVMKSFLQFDDFNCASYVFGFIQIIVNLYYKFDNNKIESIIKYLLEYFNYFSDEGFITENNNISAIRNTKYNMNINLFILPKEILKLSQSFKMLNSLKESLKKKKKFNYLTLIDGVINELQNESKIKKIRNFHLMLLSKS